MATSGTTAFDLDIDDIIEEAYERCGVRTNSGRLKICKEKFKYNVI